MLKINILNLFIYYFYFDSNLINVSPTEDTVWLTQSQISELYARDVSVISRHINNILSESECNESNLQKMQITNSDKPIILYDLEMVISVGYRVKSKRGIMFRRWANSILKQYLLKGHVINEYRWKWLPVLYKNAVVLWTL